MGSRHRFATTTAARAALAVALFASPVAWAQVSGFVGPGPASPGPATINPGPVTVNPAPVTVNPAPVVPNPAGVTVNPTPGSLPSIGSDALGAPAGSVPGAPLAGGLPSPSPFPGGVPSPAPGNVSPPLAGSLPSPIGGSLPSPQPFPGGVPSSAITPPGTVAPGTGVLTPPALPPATPVLPPTGIGGGVGGRVVAPGIASPAVPPVARGVPAPLGPYTAVQIARSFLGADTDRDGELTRAEAQFLTLAPLSFEQMDRSGDGRVTRFEYEDALGRR